MNKSWFTSKEYSALKSYGLGSPSAVKIEVAVGQACEVAHGKNVNLGIARGSFGGSTCIGVSVGLAGFCNASRRLCLPVVKANIVIKDPTTPIIATIIGTIDLLSGFFMIYSPSPQNKRWQS